MSTRHVWEKYSVARVQVSQHYSEYTLTFIGFPVMITSNDHYSRDGEVFTVPSDGTIGVLNQKGIYYPGDCYFQLQDNHYDEPDRTCVYSGTADTVLDSPSRYDKTVTISDVTRIYLDDARGNLLGYATGDVAGLYAANGKTGGNWYVKKGTDSIDPTAVSILDTPKAGKPVGVAVAPVANTYGGVISYAYEYSVDGGANWQAAQTTTATEIALTVPEGAETLQVRARASDNMGFTSADYVTSEIVTVKAAGGITVTIDGIERELDGLYACIDGILRPIGTAAVIDGIQRDIF